MTDADVLDEMDAETARIRAVNLAHVARLAERAATNTQLPPSHTAAGAPGASPVPDGGPLPSGSPLATTLGSALVRTPAGFSQE